MDIQEINDQAKAYFDNKQFSKALELLQHPDLPKELLGNLAKCYYYTHQADKALEIMLSLDKDQNAWIDTALYYNALGQSEQSHQIYKTLDPSNAKVRFNLGYHLLQSNRFLEGFQHLESGIELRAWGSEYVLEEKQIIDRSKRWKGQHTDTLAMVLEGGLGDEFIFLRWANYLKTRCKVLKVFLPSFIT
jgi:tetratricopeptide (TPR) repeat protein